MAMRPVFDKKGDNKTRLVDKVIGNAYGVVKLVASHLEEIKYTVENMKVISDATTVSTENAERAETAADISVEAKDISVGASESAEIYKEEARLAASSASNSAIVAEEAKDQVIDIRDRNYGAFPTDPTERLDGSAMQPGDQYFNTTDNVLKVFDGSSWYVPNIDGQLLAGEDGAAMVGFKQDGVDAVPRTALDKLRDTVNVMDFGAVGDGITDDTLAFQAAIDAVASGGGGRVDVPAATYRIASSILMRSGVTVQCDESAVLNCNDSSASRVIYFLGSAGVEFALTANAGVGDTTITVGGEPGLNAGDVIHLVAVRNAASRTDAGNYWLGDGTAGAAYAYFAEWNSIAEDLGGGQFRLATPLIFPGYNVDASAETETLRTTSAVQIVTPLRDSHWIGGTVIRDESGLSVFESRWAMDCSVDSVKIVRGRREGSSVRFGASLRCVGKNIINTNDPTIIWDYATLHGKLNRFLTVGSQDCGFVSVTDSFAAQSVDFTYAASSFNFVNARSYCRNSNFYRCFEALTSHPGCYQELWDGNRVLDCLTGGIIVRGLQPTIINNVITSTVTGVTGVEDVESYGISFAYGGPRRGVAYNNVIRDFYVGVQIRSSTTLDWYYTNCLIDIAHNEISGCFIGLETIMAGSENNSIRFIQYRSNRHSAMGRYIVYLGEYSAGTSIRDNVFDGAFRYTGGRVSFLYARYNNPMIEFTNNSWRRPKGTNAGDEKNMFFSLQILDTTTYPESEWAGQTKVAGNTVTFRDDDGMVETSIPTVPYCLMSTSSGFSANVSDGSIYIPRGEFGTSLVTVATEDLAPIDDLDRLLPIPNLSFNIGDVVHLRTGVNSRDIVIRDSSVSGVATHGFELPGNNSITLGSSNDIATFIFSGVSWRMVSVSYN